MAAITASELAGLIDYSVLKPAQSYLDVEAACRAARRYGFAAVCVNTFYVEHAARTLKGSGVKVCAAVGFPLGSSLTEVKAFEARRAVERGAHEVDFVANIGLIRAGRLDEAREDVRVVVEEARRAGAEAVKVIVESGLLSVEELERACRVVEEAGADFIKTCTGFSECRARPEDVSLIRRVAPRLKVKASGGIRSLDQALALIEAGASRIGTSSAVEIVEEALKRLPR